MYKNKTILTKVVTLFTDYPNYRDDRWGTIKLLLDDVIPDKSAVKTAYIIHVAFTIDRYFRYVQQHIISLRGNEWRKRQKQGGEAGGNYDKDEKMVLKYKAQLKLF